MTSKVILIFSAWLSHIMYTCYNDILYIHIYIYVFFVVYPGILRMKRLNEQMKESMTEQMNE